MTHTPQLPLALRWSPEFALKDFLFTDPAQARLIEQFSESAALAPRALLLLGNSGTGKSYLLNALHQRQPRAMRCSTVESYQKLDAQDLPVPRLHDQVEGILGNRAAEEALFHDFNRALDQNQPWCAALRGNPHHLTFALPDLQSRLLQCTQLILPSLQDPALRHQLLQQQAHGLGFALPDGLLEYLELHVSRDLSKQVQLIKALHQESLARRQKLSLARARHLLNVLQSDPGGQP